MRLFHGVINADEILRNGFRDGPRYLVNQHASGVWLSYRPLGLDEGADAREYSGIWLSDIPLVVSDETRGSDLVVEIPEADAKPFEWAADDEACRGFLCLRRSSIDTRYVWLRTRTGRCVPMRKWIGRR